MSVRQCEHCKQFDRGQVYPCKRTSGHSWKTRSPDENVNSSSTFDPSPTLLDTSIFDSSPVDPGSSFDSGSDFSGGGGDFGGGGASGDW